MLGAALTGLAVLVYLNSFSVPFHFDDIHSIVENKSIQSLTNIPEYFTSTTSFSGEEELAGHYRPVLLVTYALNHALGGMDPAGYHFVNILLHAGVALLVYALLRRMLGQSPAAMAAALIFVVHPIHAETVNYISARSSLLCTLWVLLAMWSFVRFRASGRAWHYWLCLGASLLAVLTKEIALTLPAVMFLWDYRERIHHRPGWWKAYLPFLFAIFFFVFLTDARHLIGSIVTGQGKMDAWSQLLLQSRMLFKAMGMFVWPVGLNIAHHAPVPEGLDMLGILALAGVLAIAFLALCGLRSSYPWRRIAGWGGLWFFVTSLPTIIIPLNMPFQEHRLYLPSFGLLVVLAALLNRLPARLEKGNKRLILWVPVAVLIGILGAGTFARSTVWGDDLTLWLDAVKKSPQSEVAHYGLGYAYAERQNHIRAIREYEKTVELSPRFAQAYYNLGISYAALEQLPRAIRHYEKAIELHPGDWRANFHLGVSYARTNRWKDAVRYLEAARDVRPDTASIHVYLGVAWKTMGDFPRAQRALEQALILDEKTSSIYEHLGELYVQTDQFDRARALYQRHLEIHPGDAQTHHALGYLSELDGNLKQAQDFYQKAVQLDPGRYASYYNLGNVFWKKGETEQALRAFKKSLDLNSEFFNARFGLASLLEQMGRDPEALRHYEQILSDVASGGNSDLGEQVKTRIHEIRLRLELK